MNKIILLFLLNTIGCAYVKKTVAQNGVPVVKQRNVDSLANVLQPCRDTIYTVAKVYDSELDGKIIQRREDGWLYIECPAVSTALLLRACNLPKSIYERGVIIKFTGNLLSFPGIERAQIFARPFELTTLRIVHP